MCQHSSREHALPGAGHSLPVVLQHYSQLPTIAGHTALITQTTDLIQNVHVVQILLTPFYSEAGECSN